MSTNYLFEEAAQAEPKELDNDSWLLSYVDLLLLMVTLFVCLLSLQQNKLSEKKLVQQKTINSSIQKPKEVEQNKIFIDQVYLSDLKSRVNLDVKNNKVNLIINDNILFLPGDAMLSETGGQLLDELALMLRNKPWFILVEGHTDDAPIATPRFPSNWELSTARATTVTRRLIARGINSQRLSAIGYADTRPLDNVSKAGNRRVALVLSLPPS